MRTINAPCFNIGKSFLVEDVYKNKIVFRAIGSYIKDKDCFIR